MVLVTKKGTTGGRDSGKDSVGLSFDVLRLRNRCSADVAISGMCCLKFKRGV